jgi:hypothetical protein
LLISFGSDDYSTLYLQNQNESIGSAEGLTGEYYKFTAYLNVLNILIKVLFGRKEKAIFADPNREVGERRRR